jgi:hypothetical protein
VCGFLEVPTGVLILVLFNFKPLLDPNSSFNAAVSEVKGLLRNRFRSETVKNL